MSFQINVKLCKPLLNFYIMLLFPHSYQT